ncbi:hypothetical protein JWV37_05385 [Sulfurospirillum sp. T05]|uniref:DUF354 domain-containing protein n=1 Tax=Sulfurospirillum tamanense TaxID=2813362 RepID=A0ABS2WRB9_9BACT|nr:hypothetical protein [Sulfurospirillum tamanensis]MBN2964203.1 hypothetical protein [Sulfurospirillum tamanensis]
MREITFMGRYPLQFASLVPYIEECLRRNYKIYFCVSKSVLSAFPDLISKGETIFLEEIEKKHYIAIKTHSFLNRTCNFLFSKGACKGLLFLYKTIFSFLVKNPLKSKKIVYVTKIHLSWLLVHKELDVYTFIGSWDHPSLDKASGHKSKFVFGWNETLLCDWKRFNHDVNYGISFPMPFRYIFESRKKPLKKDNVFIVMYAFTFSETAPRGLFKEECEFVTLLCTALKEMGLKLLIKPKPNQKPEMFNLFRCYDNVEICSFNTHGEKENLLLAESYNETRIKEMLMADLVINLGTTFAIDAALFGLPVMQIKINSQNKFSTLAKQLNNAYHINHYLLYDRKKYYLISDGEEAKKEIYDCFSNKEHLLEVCNSFSQDIRSLFYPAESLGENVKKVVDKIVKD